MTLVFVGLFMTVMVGIEVLRHFIGRKRGKRLGLQYAGTQDVAFYGVILACVFLLGLIVCGIGSLIVGEKWLR